MNDVATAWISDWQDFASGPLGMPLGAWALFAGFLIVAVLAWTTILAYIISEA